jgi:flagellar protein FlbD
VWPWCAMIHLTRLNNSALTVNSDLIKFVEQSPDTVITLLSGEKILVQEPVHEVVCRIIEFRRRVLAGTGAWSHASPTVLPTPAAAPFDEGEG